MKVVISGVCLADMPQKRVTILGRTPWQRAVGCQAGWAWGRGRAKGFLTLFLLKETGDSLHASTATSLRSSEGMFFSRQ